MSDESEIAAISKGLRILAMFLRALVFGALVAMIVHVSSPQSEAIWTIYDTPRDLIRVCPKTSGGITKFSEHEAD
jgi:hypothetical protein